MKTFFGTLLAGSLVLLSMGCGRPGNAAGYDDRQQPGTNFCSQEIIDGKNKIVDELNGLINAGNVTVGQLLDLRAHAKALRDKYADVVCEARNASTGEKVTFKVNEEMDGLIAAIDKAIADAQNPREGGRTDEVLNLDLPFSVLSFEALVSGFEQ